MTELLLDILAALLGIVTMSLWAWFIINQTIGG